MLAIEQFLVRVKEHFFSNYIGEVLGVGEGRRGVEREEIGVATVERADALELAAEAGVDVGVVVDVRTERVALGEAERVAAGEDYKVVHVEALVREVGDELREVKEWRRNVDVRRRYVGECGVAPP